MDFISAIALHRKSGGRSGATCRWRPNPAWILPGAGKSGGQLYEKAANEAE